MTLCIYLSGFSPQFFMDLRRVVFSLFSFILIVRVGVTTSKFFICQRENQKWSLLLKGKKTKTHLSFKHLTKVFFFIVIVHS